MILGKFIEVFKISDVSRIEWISIQDIRELEINSQSIFESEKAKFCDCYSTDCARIIDYQYDKRLDPHLTPYT